MARKIKTIFQVRRAFSEQWQERNPILRVGEPGFSIDEGKLKIGDGKTAWNELPYIGGDIEQGGVINKKTFFEFPSIGDPNFIYKAEDEKKLYQWNSTALKYEVVSSAEAELDIEVIFGGNANG